MTKYIKEFLIPYYDTNKNGLAHPSSLLNYMGETSSFHSDSLGIGINELRKNNYGWMLNRWRVKFYKYPKAKDRITVETWTSGFDKFYATREFVVYSENKELVAKATTLWIFLDITKKRPKRIPIEFNEIYNIVDEKLLHDFIDFNIEYLSSKEIDFHVRKTDIDYNNHVNNVKYLNWMLEAIPEEIDDKYLLSELDIQYKKEIKLGDKVISSIDKGDNKGDNKGDKIIYLHTVVEDNSEDVNSFGRTVWNKKSKGGMYVFSKDISK